MTHTTDQEPMYSILLKESLNHSNSNCNVVPYISKVSIDALFNLQLLIFGRRFCVFGWLHRYHQFANGQLSTDGSGQVRRRTTVESGREAGNTVFDTHHSTVY